MKIINYGHSCFKIIFNDLSIVLDPYQDKSVPGLVLPNNLKANYVFASHSHFDHCALEKVEVIKTNEKLDVKEIILPHDKVGGQQRGMNIARLFKLGDKTILHLGDIGDVNELFKHKELENIDIVLCPINGFFTISSLDAVKAYNVLHWKLIIPMHYEIKEKGIGYPDGNQIGIFKNNIKDYIELDNDELEVSEDLFKHKSLIFLKHRG